MLPLLLQHVITLGVGQLYKEQVKQATISTLSSMTTAVQSEVHINAATVTNKGGADMVGVAYEGLIRFYSMSWITISHVITDYLLMC